RALELTKKYWGEWQHGNYKADIPDEPEQKDSRTADIDWDAPTLPHLVVAFHAPRYSDTSKEVAALDLFQQIAFGENSDLYQQLVLKEQKTDDLEPDFEHKADPELFAVYARVKDPAQVTYVRDRILKTFERYKSELIDQSKLDATRSRTRYGFALAMDSNDAIAGALAPYIALARTPETINRLFDTYQKVTPSDMRDAVKRYFRAESSTIVTLSTKGQNIASTNNGKEDGER